MLDFGFSEIVLTSAIALIVLGPEKLPKVARQVGNWMGRARAMARQLTDQLEREVNAEDLLKQITRTTAKPSVARTSSEPVPFDTSYTPKAAASNVVTPHDATPIAATPTAATPTAAMPIDAAQVVAPQAEASQSSIAAPVFTADPAQSPHGADWHSANTGNKPPNE